MIMMRIYGIWCSIVYVFIGEREEYTTPEPTPTTTTPDPEIIPIELYVLKVSTNTTLLIVQYLLCSTANETRKTFLSSIMSLISRRTYCTAMGILKGSSFDENHILLMSHFAKGR